MFFEFRTKMKNYIWFECVLKKISKIYLIFIFIINFFSSKEENKTKFGVLCYPFHLSSKKVVRVSQTVSKENGKEKKKIGILFLLAFDLFVFKEEEKSKEPNSWIIFCFGVEPMKISSPSIDVEVALIQVLEGCCLLHRESMIFAH